MNRLSQALELTEAGYTRSEAVHTEMDQKMDQEDFLTRVRLAVKEFYANDSMLIQLKTERPITHRVALYLEMLFKEKDVDCDYNRFGDDEREWVKTVERIPECQRRKKKDEEDDKYSRLYPDIVIHKRASRDKDNLAVIEIKTSDEKDDCDEEKLKRLTEKAGRFKYEFGAFLGFTVKSCKCILFVNGQARPPETIDRRVQP